MWTVYVLLCSDNSYYIGSTNNLKKRFNNHQSGNGGAYTQSHRPLRIVYTEEHPDKSSALRRESQLKKWTRSKKAALVNSLHTSGVLNPKID